MLSKLERLDLLLAMFWHSSLYHGKTDAKARIKYLVARKETIENVIM